MTFNKFIQSVFHEINVSSTFYVIMFQKNSVSFVVFKNRSVFFFACENSLKKHYINLQEDWIKKQLQFKKCMHTVQKLFLDYINKDLHWNNFTFKFILSINVENHTISLYNFCKYTLINADIKTFLEEEIFHLNSNFMQHYIEWENISWKVIFQHFDIFLKDMHKTRKNLINMIIKYYSLQLCQKSNLS